MNDAWASQNIQVIRNLMERSALYRRALAPVSLAVGALGLSAGAAGWWADIDSARGFASLWTLIAATAFGLAFFIMRRQAIQAAEPFWSPPARRVAQAMLPAMFGGLVAAVVIGQPGWREPLHAWWLPGTWMLLFGAATHAAGFFMPRGIKLFAWTFAVLGAACILYVNARAHAAGMPALRQAHLLMGAVFGGLHLLYGIYLALTEPRSLRA